MERCPSCGAEAVYVGLRTIECATSGCPNSRAPQPEPERAPVSSVEGVSEEDIADLAHELLEAHDFF